MTACASGHDGEDDREPDRAQRPSLPAQALVGPEASLGYALAAPTFGYALAERTGGARDAGGLIVSRHGNRDDSSESSPRGMRCAASA